MQILAVNRFHPLLAGLRHLYPLGIGHCQDCSRLSLQIFLINDFQSDDPLIIPAGKSQHL